MTACHGMQLSERRSRSLATSADPIDRDPQECVSSLALGTALSLWNADPHFAWDALRLSLSLCL